MTLFWQRSIVKEKQRENVLIVECLLGFYQTVHFFFFLDDLVHHEIKLGTTSARDPLTSLKIITIKETILWEWRD